MPELDAIAVDLASAEDMPQIADIYNHSVTHSIANFSTRPTTTTERLEWFRRYSTTGPHRLLVARRGTTVLGYAASSAYRPELEAFRETVEVSVSLHHTARRQGIGTRLYAALFDHLDAEPVHVALAGIALPNEASVALHRKFGFAEIGVFREYAMKDGQRISSLWMDRLLP